MPYVSKTEIKPLRKKVILAAKELRLTDGTVIGNPDNAIPVYTVLFRVRPNDKTLAGRTNLIIRCNHCGTVHTFRSNSWSRVDQRCATCDLRLVYSKELATAAKTITPDQVTPELINQRNVQLVTPVIDNNATNGIVNVSALNTTYNTEMEQFIERIQEIGTTLAQSMQDAFTQFISALNDLNNNK